MGETVDKICGNCWVYNRNQKDHSLRTFCETATIIFATMRKSTYDLRIDQRNRRRYLWLSLMTLVTILWLRPARCISVHAFLNSKFSLKPFLSLTIHTFVVNCVETMFSTWDPVLTGVCTYFNSAINQWRKRRVAYENSTATFTVMWKPLIYA